MGAGEEVLGEVGLVNQLAAAGAFFPYARRDLALFARFYAGADKIGQERHSRLYTVLRCGAQGGCKGVKVWYTHGIFGLPRRNIMNAIEFGQAVHAILPYLKQHGFSRNFVYDMPMIFKRYTAIPVEWWRLPSLERERLSACWVYVYDLVACAEKAFVEVKTSTQSRPDLILVHEGVIYVVEIKTGHPQNSRVKGNRQVRSMVSDLMETYFPTHRIEGYRLVFDRNYQEPFAPQWRKAD